MLQNFPLKAFLVETAKKTNSSGADELESKNTFSKKGSVIIFRNETPLHLPLDPACTFLKFEDDAEI